MAANPREPLSPEEVALARVYAALPGGEPSTALDARVLAQARAAVAPARRRPRPWFLMPGVGAAAAAVMAAGMAWQLGWLGEAQLPDAAQAPMTESVAPAARPKKEEEKQRVDIDYVRQEASREAADSTAEVDAEAPAAALRKPTAPPAPPAPPPPPPELREQAKAAPEFVPEPPPPVVLDDATPMSTPAPQPAAPAESAASTASNAQLGAAAAGRATTLDRIERARVAELPPWPQDAQLAPEPWLERVRERVRLGDRQGAEFSLRRFVQTYPTQPVPVELQRLLVE